MATSLLRLVPGLLLVAIVGCGGVSDALNLVAATGTVLYNNEPVSGATVTFIVEKAPLATGTTDAEGKFVLTTGERPGAPLGNAKVSISKVSASQENLTSMKPEDMANMAAQGKMKLAESKPAIPLKYATPDKSGLTAALDANAESNVFEFRLVD